MEHPDVAGIANEIETGAVELDAEIHRWDQSPQRFLMFLAGRNGAVDRSPEIWMIELTGYAERNG